MPAVQLSSADLGNVTAYVQALSTTPFEKMNVAQKAGKDVFDAHCAACHQPSGKGMTAMGAPDLTDPIWQYGGSTSAIEQDITHGLNGVMPAANPDILSPSKVHLLTAYIYELSHR
jgi:cytochrome c oxidase cbb3-type subunit 3